jgi:hypothetical protein
VTSVARPLLQRGRARLGADRRRGGTDHERRPSGARLGDRVFGWAYYGEKAIEYLFGEAAIRPYRVLWVAAVMVGSVASLPAVWSFADVANGLMAIPNLVCLLAMTGVVVAETRVHLWQGPERPGDAAHRQAS